MIYCHQEWTDDYLTWDKSEYDTDLIVVKVTEIWHPDIMTRNRFVMSIFENMKIMMKWMSRLLLVSYMHYVCLRVRAYVCVTSLRRRSYNFETNGKEHFQSNSASPICLLLVHDLYFIWISQRRISRKLWDVQQTLLLPSDRKSCICHRMAQLRILYNVTWPTFSRLQNLKC